MIRAIYESLYATKSANSANAHTSSCPTSNKDGSQFSDPATGSRRIERPVDFDDIESGSFCCKSCCCCCSNEHAVKSTAPSTTTSSNSWVCCWIPLLSCTPIVSPRGTRRGINTCAASRPSLVNVRDGYHTFQTLPKLLDVRGALRLVARACSTNTL